MLSQSNAHVRKFPTLTPHTGQAAVDNVRPVHVELCLQVGQSRIKVGACDCKNYVPGM